MRAGVIGLGGMGRRHCEAITRLDGAALTAVCDMSAEAVERAGGTYPDAARFTSWREMLAAGRLDVVVVATNGPSHAEIVVAAAESGAGRILCEKPMASSLAQAQRMIDACRERHVRLTINHVRRWCPSYLRLKQLIVDGVIGPVRHVLFEIGGGQMASNGGHFWDLVRFLTDAEPTRAWGTLDAPGAPHPRGPQYFDPGGHGVMHMSNGARVFCDMSEDYGTTAFVEVLGAIGRVVIDERQGRFDVSARRPEDRAQPMTRRPDMVAIPFEGGPVDLASCTFQALGELIDTGRISCTGEDGLQSLHMTIGVHESHRLRRDATFPVPAERWGVEYAFT